MFKKYNSIENTYRKEFLEKIKGHGFWEDEYVVQEKVHGSNISFWTTNGVNYQAAKRSGNIVDGEAFYRFDYLLEKHKMAFTSIWNTLKSTHSDLEQMTIYGEVMGGNYPHPEVDRIKDASKVQKGIFYGPDNYFYAFDILLNADKYLNVEEANKHFEKEELLYAKTLFKGSIEECMTYTNSFDSTIPKELGLPELTPNICEGTIIRPIINSHFNGGSRVILKNKNDAWAEKIKSDKKIRLQANVPEHIRVLQEAILDYVTENRLNNVVSKIGKVSMPDFGKVLGLFNKDVIEDFLKDHEVKFTELDKKERKMVTKSFTRTAATMVRNKLRR